MAGCFRVCWDCFKEFFGTYNILWHCIEWCQCFEKTRAIFCRGVRHISPFRCVWNMWISYGERGRTACTDNVFSAFCPFVLEVSRARMNGEAQNLGKGEDSRIWRTVFGFPATHHPCFIMFLLLLELPLWDEPCLGGVVPCFPGTLKLPNKTKLFSFDAFCFMRFPVFCRPESRKPCHSTSLQCRSGTWDGQGMPQSWTCFYLPETPDDRWCMWVAQ